jgi:hypothetical protein
MTTRLPPNSIRLWHQDTAEGDDLYPIVPNERTSRTQTGTWAIRVVDGPTSADSEQFLASWTQDDYSAGFGIEDANESTDSARYHFGIIDARRPRHLCLPPLTETIAEPSGVTGDAYPLGDVGTQFYVSWEDDIFGWNSTTDAWHSTRNTWGGSFVPVNRPVAFCGKLYVPGGAQGSFEVSELTAATGTLTLDALAINALAFGLWDNCLWAIDTDKHLWQLTVAGATLDGGDVANWVEKADSNSTDIVLNTGLTPTHLFQYFNAGQEEVLWCLTRGQGAYMYDAGGEGWIKTTVAEGAHPDWGIAQAVFRDGEDLFIAAGGLDVTRFTSANVEVPLSGPSKDQGVPPEYQGTIVDLIADRSSMYALVQAGASVAAGSPSSQWVLQAVYGSGPGSGTAPLQFNSPQQVAVDSTGNVYVADHINNRVVKLTSAGVYTASLAFGGRPRGVCVDASDNVYVTHSSTILQKFNSALVSQWFVVFGSTLSHATTDGTHVYVADLTGNLIYKRLCSTGAAVASWGSAGTGNGQFDGPWGITNDGSFVYVTDLNNHRIQKFNLTGTYQTQWGSSGTGNNQYSLPAGITTDDSGDLWICDGGNARLQRTSNTGTYQTSIAQSAPSGVARFTGDILYVSSGQNNLSHWDEESIGEEAVAAKCWLAAWTGTAWVGLWEGADSIVPTWMRIGIEDEYALWWGDGDGNVYRQLIPPPFFNPVARVKLGAYPFAATGWLETVKYDANMTGWDKVASHFFAYADYADADVYVDVSYRTDADAFDAITTNTRLDPAFRAWKRVDHTGRTLMWFDDDTTDERSGLPRREGESFQWIQFRFDFARGSDTYESPIWTWHSLHHFPVPQDNSSFVLKIPLAYDKKWGGRSVDRMAEDLIDLQTRRGMVWLQTSNPRPDDAGKQVYFRGKVTQVKSEFYPGADNNLTEVLVLTFVELGASSNLHTTEAP